MNAGPLKSGAVRLTYGDVDESNHERLVDHESLADAADRAQALANALRSASGMPGRVPDELRSALIRAAQDIALRVRQVVL